jgi:peptidoglycan/xylan/chitin deacetylase (PgdA/CDA1 family)
MWYKTILIIGVGLFFSAFSFSAPKIILKLDDLSVKKGICEFVPTLDYLIQRQIKAGLGIIASRNDSTALQTLMPYINAKNTKGDNLFEIWHHGLDHVRPEFLGTGFEYQKSHFEEADQIAKNLLGIQMNTFGTPYNGSDSTTNRVISENPNYKVFMFSSLNTSEKNGILYLDNRVNMENGTGNPEFAYFKENYTKYKGNYADYMILQGHPNKWTPEKLEQFKLIVDFLISEGCEFVLPYDYWHSLKKSNQAKNLKTNVLIR